MRRASKRRTLTACHGLEVQLVGRTRASALTRVQSATAVRLAGGEDK
jgi:hypothetical protein